MYKPCLPVALVTAMTGCAGIPAEPEVNAAETPPGIETAQALDTAVTEIDIADIPADRTRCENLTRPGSRIVVAQRCYSLSPEDQLVKEEMLAGQIEQALRDQDALDRMRREAEERRRSASAIGL